MPKNSNEREGVFISFVKKLGSVLVPIGVVYGITNSIFQNKLYVEISVIVTIIVLYIISLEMRLNKLERGRR